MIVPKVQPKIHPKIFGVGDTHLLYGGGRPPVSDKLLAWLKGNASDSLRVDSYKTPGDFPMDLKQSFCLDADGATDSGVTSIAHGTLVSSGGTSTVTYSSTSLSMTAGTLWRLEFSDGTIYPLAEGSGATCFSTDGLHSIALTSGNLTALRSSRQDEYHWNVTGGFGYRENLLKYSEAYSEAVWVTAGTASSIGNTIFLPSEGDSIRQRISLVFTTGVTVKWVAKISGSGTMNIKLDGSASGTLASLSIALTDTPTEYSASGVTSGTESFVDFYIRRLDGQSAVEITCELTQVTISDGNYQETRDYTLDGTEHLPFLADHKPNTWNGAETKQSFKQIQVATFDGVVDSAIIPSDTWNDSLDGILELEFECIIPQSQSTTFTPIMTKENSTDLGWYLLTTDDFTNSMFRVDTSDGLNQYIIFPSIVNGEYHKVKLSLTGTKIVVIVDGTEYSQSYMHGNGFKVDNSLIIMSRSSLSKYTEGKVWNVRVNGRLILLSEGSGSDIHDSQGNIVGTITSSSLTDFWANKVTPQALLDMDAPYELFTDATTKDVKLLTQDEIVAGCNTNNQYFSRVCEGKDKEIILYKEALVGDDLEKVKVRECLP